MGLVFRYVIQERLRRLFVPGMRVLDLGCGTGEDALLLAGSGVSVHAIDIAPGMVEKARAKAEERGIPASRLRIELRAAEELAGAGEGFDGAYSNFGALNCADLPAVGRGLARALKPSAPLLLSWMGPRPLPAMLRRGLTGQGEPRGRRDPRVGGVAVPVRHPRAREVRRLMGPEFSWRTSFALGILLPGPENGAWATRHPGAFGILAALEKLLRGWPVFRGLGDHLALEGERR